MATNKKTASSVEAVVSAMTREEQQALIDLLMNKTPEEIVELAKSPAPKAKSAPKRKAPARKRTPKAQKVESLMDALSPVPSPNPVVKDANMDAVERWKAILAATPQNQQVNDELSQAAGKKTRKTRRKAQPKAQAQASGSLVEMLAGGSAPAPKSAPKAQKDGKFKLTERPAIGQVCAAVVSASASFGKIDWKVRTPGHPNRGRTTFSEKFEATPEGQAQMVEAIKLIAGELKQGKTVTNTNSAGEQYTKVNYYHPTR